ncbi:Intersectin-2 [Blyttiomyces sp. JEL0837]|nr:Intersectin-2 [Blyttiomyces sp. JEL0837]
MSDISGSDIDDIVNASYSSTLIIKESLPSGLRHRSSSSFALAVGSDDVLAKVPPPSPPPIHGSTSSKSFAEIWANPIARLYFLMFLIKLRRQDLYLFRIDCEGFRRDFHQSSPSVRKSISSRITQSCSTAMSYPEAIRYISSLGQDLQDWLAELRYDAENPEINTFDKASWISLKAMESLFNGGFNVGENYDPGFENSAYCQALRNDLGSWKVISNNVLLRAAERVMDSTHDTTYETDRILQHFESFGLDPDQFRQGSSLQRTLSKRNTATGTSRAKSLNTLNDRKKVSDDHSVDAEPKEARRTTTKVATVMLPTDVKVVDIYATNTVEISLEYCVGKVILLMINSHRVYSTRKKLPIQEGVSKMNEAANALPTKSRKRMSLQEGELQSHAEKATKKLELLQNELHKCKLQLAATDTMKATLAASNQSVNQEVIKVTLLNAETKTESTCTFLAPNPSNCQTVISLALQKLRLDQPSNDFILSYVNEFGDWTFLKNEDSLNRELMEISNGEYRLSLRSALDQTSHIPFNEKQKGVLAEIIDTEHGYASDLHIIVNIFLAPIVRAGLISEDEQGSLFSNIKDIYSLHEKIAQQLPSLRELHSAGLKSTIEVFASHLCESNPKLNKLSLSDFLVKPMHRVTRYPILFKRLVSVTPKQAPEYELLNRLIKRLEEKLREIDDTVHKTETTYRINFIDENLEYGNAVEKFTVANGRRELVSEKSFSYLSKKSGTANLDVKVFVFTDMILITRTTKKNLLALVKPPIPLEDVVLIDQPNSEGEMNFNTFNIIQLRREVHSLQAISAYEKNSWLADTETLRSKLSLSLCIFESNFENYQIPNTDKSEFNIKSSREAKVSSSRRDYVAGSGSSSAGRIRSIIGRTASVDHISKLGGSTGSGSASMNSSGSTQQIRQDFSSEVTLASDSLFFANIGNTTSKNDRRRSKSADVNLDPPAEGVDDGAPVYRPRRAAQFFGGWRTPDKGDKAETKAKHGSILNLSKTRELNNSADIFLSEPSLNK